MRLSDYRQTYYDFSAKTSDVARKLAFAGIALVWIFKVETNQGAAVPRDLLVPSVLLALALAFDLLQYVSGTCVWGVFQWKEEGKLEDLKQDPDLDSPSWLTWPQFAFFVLKLASVAFAYLLLVRYIWAIWFRS